MRSQEGHATLGILLQLVDSLSLDAQLVGNLLEGASLKVGEEGDVLFIPLNGREVTLAIALAARALRGPCRLLPATNRAGIPI